METQTDRLKRPAWLVRLHEWRVANVSDKMFLLILAFLVGLLSAVAAYILHGLINTIVALLTGKFQTDSYNWLYLVYPVIGIWLTSLFVRYIVKDNISHGITRILYAISIGSNLGKIFRLDNKTLMTLVGCGAAGAIAGIFKAPIAGLVFTLEVLMIDLTMASLLPILVSCVTATCFTYIFSGNAVMFSFTLDSDWTVERVPASILLGITCGLVSLYFIRAMNACEDMFARFKDKPYVKLLIGGIILSTLIFLFPSLYGEGYHSINLLLNGRTEADWNQILEGSLFYGHSEYLILYIGLVLLTKVFATSATNGGGGCGGTFAPSLFIGCFTGFLFSRLWNMHQIGVYVPEKNFALLGMAGVMSGVMHAPLTGIFLIAEITSGYNLFMPLMIVAVSSYLTINIFEKHSIYGMRLAKQGKLKTHHTDHAALTLMSLDSVIDRDFQAVDPDMDLGQMVHYISRSRHRVLPVTDAAGVLLGEINIVKIRHVVFRTELYHHFRASQLMSKPDATLSDSTPMTEVMRTFERTQADWFPVLDADNHLKGYISRKRMYNMYRKMVHDLSQD